VACQLFATLTALDQRNATQSSVLRVSLQCMHNQIGKDHVVAVSGDFDVVPGISKNGMFSVIPSTTFTNDVNTDINIDLHNASSKPTVSPGSITIRLTLDPNFIVPTASKMVDASHAMTQARDDLRRSGIMTDVTRQHLEMADPQWTHLLESLLKLGKTFSAVRAFVIPEC
jgi:hypothetical protein